MNKITAGIITLCVSERTRAAKFILLVSTLRDSASCWGFGAGSQVVCIVKRMGGGFGGKEAQAAPLRYMPLWWRQGQVVLPVVSSVKMTI